MKEKAVLHTISVMHGKARQGFWNLYSTNHENGPEMTFVAATKINFTNLKTLYDWMIWSDLIMIWRHQLYSEERLETLTNSGRSLTLTYKFKALKLSL